MPSLEGAATLGQSLLQTDEGMEFFGTIMPVSESAIPSYDFTTPRNIIRVPSDSPLTVGKIIVDAFSRRFLTAIHDSGFLDNRQLYKVYRLYVMNSQSSWIRGSNIIDPLTKISKGNTDVELGPIWVNREPIGREEIDLTFRVKEQSYQILTNADVRLNDKIDGMVVKRVDNVLGIKKLEIQ